MKLLLKENKNSFIDYLKDMGNDESDSIILLNRDEMFADMSCDKIESLYYTYEFSDKLQLITHKNIPYADLLNYIDTGLLTIEEAAEAFLN